METKTLPLTDLLDDTRTRSKAALTYKRGRWPSRRPDCMALFCSESNYIFPRVRVRVGPVRSTRRVVFTRVYLPKVSDASQSFRGGTSGVYRQHTYSGIKEVLTMAYKEGGVRGLYRGIGEACDKKDMLIKSTTQITTLLCGGKSHHV
ncbi:unnamed protein product [Eruca vesicaria subsp. sativa]|uniref:Uncharacterized protein n=1 Tax=Eruca vesicaria subsp. sativa TaxID=29727 RepID=A0ABC8JW20_ERUVS|nr:unnamed protein product [Eruca vesicaria subsp. sativa]